MLLVAFGEFIVTPALLGPSIVQRPVSPALVGVFPLSVIELLLSGHETISAPALAMVMDSTVILTS